MTFDKEVSPTAEAVLASALRFGGAGVLIGAMAELPGAYSQVYAGALSVDQAATRLLHSAARTAIAAGVGGAASALAGNNGLAQIAAVILGGGLALHALGGGSAVPARAPVQARRRRVAAAQGGAQA